MLTKPANPPCPRTPRSSCRVLLERNLRGLQRPSHLLSATLVTWCLKGLKLRFISWEVRVLAKRHAS